MANTAQARKRVRQSQKRRQHNAARRSMSRTLIKHVVRALEGRDVSRAWEAYQRMVPVLDRMATRRLIHRNKAARHKSRLLHRLQALG